MTRRVIFNADDFGLTEGVSRGIVECHEQGVVTSTSLMVHRPGAAAAAALARRHPQLAVGLHFDVGGEREHAFDKDDPESVRAELERQLEAFRSLIGTEPTHLDSHWHVHTRPHLEPVFRAAAEALDVPLRAVGAVSFVGGFYAQWEYGVTELEHVGVAALEAILRDETRGPWTEVACHPGFVDGGLDSVYASEREVEMRTLTSPRIREALAAAGLELASFREAPR
jgi:predicted glycoside hydrolase/deacetylase ChbG (UPF0249 family)